MTRKLTRPQVRCLSSSDSFQVAIDWYLLKTSMKSDYKQCVYKMLLKVNNTEAN